MTPGRRSKGLSPEDQSLWAKIVESIRPLSGRAAAKPSAPEPEPPAAPPKPAKPAKIARPARPAGAPKAPPPVTRPPPLAPIEPKLARSLKKGAAVDARLDLHGMFQDEAHDRLLRFLRSQQARGARVVLVITGKGSSGGDSGVLRRLVPAWLAEPALRDVVLGFSEAAQAHGGAGALYVRLRRPR